MPVGLPATKVLKALYYSRSEKSFPAASTGVDGLEGIRVMAPEQTLAKASSRHIRVEARPASIDIDGSRSGVIVVDMQNDFGAEGGMFHRAGIGISAIHAAVAPTRSVLTWRPTIILRAVSWLSFKERAT